MSTSQKLEVAIEKISALSQIEKSRYTSITVLRQLHDERASKFLFELETAHARPLDLGNCVSGIFSVSQYSTEFFNIKSALDWTLAQPDFVAAESKVGELVADVRRLEAQLAEEELAAGRERQQRADALAKAEQAALAEVRAKFLDPEPEAEPEPPAPPFRGKGLKMASA
jgi:hypothetical protein